MEDLIKLSEQCSSLRQNSFFIINFKTSKRWGKKKKNSDRKQITTISSQNSRLFITDGFPSIKAFCKSLRLAKITEEQISFSSYTVYKKNRNNFVFFKSFFFFSFFDNFALFDFFYSMPGHRLTEY